MQDLPAIPSKCMHCQADLRFPMVCSGCLGLNPIPDGLDYFQLLGFPRSYQMDLGELNRRFLDITRHIHPDRFAHAGETTRSLATRLTALVNRAKTVLADPVLRAEYLLSLEHGTNASDDRSVAPELLSQVLMIREELEEALGGHDAAAVREIESRVARLETEAMAQLARLAHGLPGASESERAELRRMINGIKYYQKLREELEQTRA